MSERASPEVRPLLRDDERLFRVLRGYAAVFLPAGLLLMAVFLSAGPDWRTNRVGNVLGHDFSQVWAAGRAALRGMAAQVYDVDAHVAHQVALFGRPDQVFGWHYPPPFLLPAAGFGTLPYGAALAGWVALSATLFVVALRSITPRWDVILVALAVPLFLRNLGYAQNGLLTASLLALGVTLVDRRPVLAGFCLGLLCYKPQLGLLVPVALVAGARWTAFAAAAATAAAACALSWLAFGGEAWAAFLGSLSSTNAIILRDGMAGLDLNMSAFGAVRLLGGPSSLAWAVQAACAAAAVLAVAAAWRRGGDTRLAGAVLLAAVPMATPYVPDYDLAVLIPAAVLAFVALAPGGQVPDMLRFAAILAFVASFAPRAVAKATGLPVGFLAAALLFTAIAAAAAGPPRPAPRPGGARPLPA